ncbi:methyltransferase domain-containing protein [Longimicrobium terrae]|uniref:SAM-dependent methyltransferase n=1 Tax=Longimicrobium terrae TaxID=1639882 RepID=A0A841H4L2_9BACT|nr:SAM-dependent methyltransferase [Longimicrobium terrae]MBB6072903.1 SAM-dependent methyltransferase [Longimicrobium terrae]NNC31516.1 class I SAM-dependent methyltransferase [Longimicrobium terrae]
MVQPADWNNFRVDQISWPTFAKRNLIHWDLIRETVRRAAGSALEVGVGSGAQSALISRWVPHTVTVDNDARIMKAALPNLERFGPRTRVVGADAFRLPFADQSFGVSLSQGLMEHFSDEQIHGLVREQLRVCRSVVFSVPSDRYPRQDVGNERLMTPAQWAAIIGGVADASRYTVRARYYRGDLEALKYSILARKALGSFSVLVTIDRKRG